MEKITDNGIEYKKTDSGTCYYSDTPDLVIDICEQAIRNRSRVKIRYKPGYEDFTGYTKDGLNVTMYIGRSTGQIKIPLHICNSRSRGGTALSTNLIDQIQIIKK